MKTYKQFLKEQFEMHRFFYDGEPIIHTLINSNPDLNYYNELLKNRFKQEKKRPN